MGAFGGDDKGTIVGVGVTKVVFGVLVGVGFMVGVDVTVGTDVGSPATLEDGSGGKAGAGAGVGCTF